MKAVINFIHLKIFQSFTELNEKLQFYMKVKKMEQRILDTNAGKQLF